MLSKLGAKMMLIARNEAKLQETISMLEGEGHKYYLLDINELEKLKRVLRISLTMLVQLMGWYMQQV